MKKFNLWLLLSLFVSASMFTACCSTDDVSGGGGDVPGPGPVPAPMSMAQLSGFVYDEFGDPIDGVTVTSGTSSVKTNAHGAFTLSSVNVVNGRSVVRFSKPGSWYADVVRSVEAKEGDVWEVAMPSISNVSFDSSTGRLLSLRGMKVDIPANSIKETTEAAYTGNVDSRMAYLDPNDENFSSMMPGGDLAATGYGEKDPSNPNPQLISYGMTSVELSKSQTEALQLNGVATVTFPAPAGLEEHDIIPLWGFNEETGLWEYEGDATKQPDGTYQGTVTHFSWHNLDYPEKRASCKVIVKDNAGRAIPFQKVIVGQVQATTDTNGEFSCNVPTNTPFVVTVKSIDYSNYTPEVEQNVTITTAGEVREVNIVLPSTSKMSGTITNKGAGAQVSLNLTYGDKAVKSVMSDVNGKYVMNLPLGYTGSATLDILAADGTIFKKNITLTGEDQVVDYSIDAPETAKGNVSFEGEGVNETLTISDFSAYTLGGVVIMGNQIEIMSGSHHHHSSSSGEPTAYISINGDYDPGQSSYSGYLNAMRYSEDSEEGIHTQNATINISRNGNVFEFATSGPGNYFSYSAEGQVNASGTVNGKLIYSLLAEIAETGASTSPASWVPTLSGKTPTLGATIADNPKLGTGWYVEYNNEETYDDYMTLVNSAKATMGTPYYVNDDADDPYYKQYVFISGNQYLSINYNGYSSTRDKLYISEVFGDYSSGRIVIRAFSNVTVPFTELVGRSYK